MLNYVVYGFPPHWSVHFELPGSWKYSPIFGLMGAFVNWAEGIEDAGFNKGFIPAGPAGTASPCDPVDAVVDGIISINGVHSTYAWSAFKLPVAIGNVSVKSAISLLELR